MSKLNYMKENMFLKTIMELYNRMCNFQSFDPMEMAKNLKTTFLLANRNTWLIALWLDLNTLLITATETFKAGKGTYFK